MKTVKFNPNGERLWVKIDMKGIYSISYVYSLLDANETTPLTSPPVQGDNIEINDDQHIIVNSLNIEDPLAVYDKRVVYVSFLVTQVDKDFGFKLRVSVHQGNDFNSSTFLGNDEYEGKVGDDGIVRKKIQLKLSK